MNELTLDGDKSTIRIHTFAEGLFARVAHDIELACRKCRGVATRDGDVRKAHIEVPLAGIDVSGVLKDNQVNANILSTSDRRSIVDKMRREVFHAPETAIVHVEANFESGKATIRLVTPIGPPVEIRAPVELHENGPNATVTGSIAISLSSIGSDVVKGPMGAFRVKDRVEVLFDLHFSQS